MAREYPVVVSPTRGTCYFDAPLIFLFPHRPVIRWCNSNTFGALDLCCCNTHDGLRWASRFFHFVWILRWLIALIRFPMLGLNLSGQGRLSRIQLLHILARIQLLHILARRAESGPSLRVRGLSSNKEEADLQHKFLVQEQRTAGSSPL